MIRLYERNLFQWDIKQKIVIEEPDNHEISEIHFSNSDDLEAVKQEILEENGLKIAYIPDDLLMKPTMLHVHAVYTEYEKNESGEICSQRTTLERKSFKILRRACPEDYPYSPQQIRIWHSKADKVQDKQYAGMVWTVGENGELTFTKGGSGEEGTLIHSKLLGRDEKNQHPIAAITGLEDGLYKINTKLSKKADSMESDGQYWYLTADGERIAGPYDLGSGGGSGTGGGGSSITNISIVSKDWPSTISYGAECKLKVIWNSTKNEIPTGNGTLSVYVNDKLCLTQKNCPQGEVELDVTKYLIAGTNMIEVRALDAYSNLDKVVAQLTTVSIGLSSNFNADRVLKGTVNYTYIPVGAVKKIVSFKLDGVEIGTQIVNSSNEQQTFPLTGLTHGSHTFSVQFECDIDGNKVKSNELYYDLLYEVSGNKTAMISSTFRDLQQEQYVAFTIPYRVYTPDYNTSIVGLYVNDVLQQELSVNQDLQYWEYKAMDYGEYTLEIRSGNAKPKTFVINVLEASIDVTAATQDLSLYLSSYGRSNAEANPEIWRDDQNNIDAELNNFNFVSDGWKLDSEGNTVLRVTGDARVLIPYKIFEEDFRSTGKTIEIEFSTSVIKNYESNIISCWSGDRGFYITPQLAKMKSQQKEIQTQYKEDEHVRVSFVVEKNVETHLILMYLNGIMSGCVQYPLDDNFRQLEPVGISIGSNDATVEIYNIRIYDNNLNRKQMVNNWIADTQSGALRKERFMRNDNYNDAGEIVINKLPTDLPYIIYEAAELPTFKGDKKDTAVQFVDPTDENNNYTTDSAQIDVQGTSSQYYFRKNFKVKYKNGFTQGAETNSKYPIRPGAIKEKEFTYKADVASSEGANNVELVRFYEDSKGWKVPPENENPAVRTGIDGFPIVAFHNNGEKTYFYGKMNFNNDKGTPDTFGFDDGDESWEITNNNTDLVLFKSDDMSAWDKSFESRYPEEVGDDEHAYGTAPSELDKLTEMVQWVYSTRRFETDSEEVKQAKLNKFKTELSNYFDVESTLFYYLFTEVFLLADSRAKNAFPTYYKSRTPGDGGDHWFWIPYDMDTALGINNEGLLVFDYNLEDTDLVHGAYVFNGQDSTMWMNVRDAFKDELGELYQTLRARSSNSEEVQWSYENVEKYFSDHQSKWSESIFNEDAYSKYLTPLIQSNDATYLGMLQGSKAEQRKWWLYNRFKYIDSKYKTGDAKSTTIMLRAYQKSDFKIVPYMNLYVTAAFDNQIVSERALRDQAYDIKSPDTWDPAGTDSVVGVYSADQLKEIGDISGFKVGYADFSKATKLQHLIIGSAEEGYSNEKLEELNIGNNSMLSVLDVRNCPNLKQPIDVSNCINIEEIYFDGTAITGINLPVGGILKKLHLPNTLTNLTIRNQKMLNDLQIAGTENIQSLWLENIPKEVINAQELIMQMPTNAEIRLIGFEDTLESVDEIYALYNLLDTMKGITAAGEYAEKAQVNGKIYTNDISYADYTALMARYPDVQIIPTKIICTVTFLNDGEKHDEQLIIQGEDAQTPVIDPVRPETAQFYYTFNGWDADYTNVQTDLVINATYEEHIQIYEVVFDTQTTLVSTPSQMIPYGEKALRPEDPFIEGTTFDGWFLESYTLTPYDFDQVITGPLTLYGKWTDTTSPIVVEVARNSEVEFSYSVTDNIAVTGYAITNSAEEPTEWIEVEPITPLEGTYVVGAPGTYYVWAKDAAGHTDMKYITAYSVEKEAIIGTEIIAPDFALDGSPLVLDVILDSHYENLKVLLNEEEIATPHEIELRSNIALRTEANPKTYKVSFNMGGRGEPVEDQFIVYNNLVQKPENQFVTGYIIEDWYNSPMLDTPWNFYYDTVSEDITLYAKWIHYVEPSIIKIEVEENQAIKFNFSQTVEYGVEVDWGDESTITTTDRIGNMTLEHIYREAGEKEIRVTCKLGSHLLGAGFNKPIISPADCMRDIEFAWNMPTTALYAFQGANNLTHINLSRYMSEIAPGAFYDCKGLVSVNVPDPIKKIGDQAFYGCTSLTGKFTVSRGIRSIGDYAFNGCVNITGFDIPEQIESFGKGAFYDCKGLLEFEIPEHITVLNTSLFQGCTSLTSFEVSDSITELKASAFNGCTGLTKVILKNPDLILGETVFSGCTKLITAGPIGGDYNIEFAWEEEIPDNAFATGRDGSALKSIKLPDTLKKIGRGAFSLSSITSIELPDSLEEIGDNAFFWCERLKIDKLPPNLKYIGSSAFYRCYAIKELTLPASIISIGNRAFEYCFNINKFYLNFTSSENKIETYANSWFSKCNANAALYIPAAIPDADAAAVVYGACWNYYDDGLTLTYYAIL